MDNLYHLAHPEPEESKNTQQYQHCLCINPKCSDSKRPMSEGRCGVCGSDLILNNRYRVINEVSPREKSRRDRSTLFEVVDITDNKKSKVIKILHTDDTEAIIRFERSADVLMNHWFEGIPKIDKWGHFHIEFPNDPIPAYCLVMEKIEGINLQQWLKITKNKPLSQNQAIDWLKQLAIILERLHDRKFIHRDIKPSNIMLKNSDGKLILIDFDAVRPITQAVNDGKTLTVIGTDAYIPPEQIRGRAVPQSDFYALGRTFVHLLTGKPPNVFEEDRDRTLRWRSSAPQVSRFLADFLDNLMAWSSDNRPRNTKEILQRLKDIERNLEHQKIIKNWLTFDFKKASRLVGISLVLLVAVYSINNPKNSKLDKPETNPTPTSVPTQNDKLCRTQKDGEINVNALSDAANAAIINKNDPNLINFPRKRLKVKGQIGCKVIIEVYLKEGEQFTLEQKELIKKLIEENIYPDAKKLLVVDFLVVDFQTLN